LPLASTIEDCFNGHVTDELRRQILAYGVPKNLLDSFAQHQKQKVQEPLQNRIRSLERRVMDLSDQSSTWRVKYMNVDEKLQSLMPTMQLQEKKLASCQKAIGKLSAYVRQLRKEVFGDHSERMSRKESATAADSPPTPSEQLEKPKRGKRPGTKGHGRKHDEGLPVEPVRHDLESADKRCRCGGEYELSDLPPVTSKETHIEEKILVREHQRRKAARRCRQCGRSAGIKTAPKPPRLIPKSKYSDALWRFIIEEKFWLQRPLNRVIQKLRSLGLIARPSTLTNGLHVLYKHRIFEVIYEAIIDRSKLAEQRHMDETGWKVFAENEAKDSPRWHLWVSITVDATVFILDPSKSNQVIQQHLSGVADGIIICDRASSFKCFAKNNEGFIIAFCWVHQRRDFIKLKDGYPQHTAWAEQWITRIDALILQNKLRLSAMETPAEYKREDKALRKMIKQIERKIESDLSDKSLTDEQRACAKSLREHWLGLTVFVNFPHVPMSNNEAERALRDAVIGRKTYYGSRSLWSGLQTSWLFTIYATLEQNGINPHQWMTEYLDACANNSGLPPPEKVIQRFLPWNYRNKPAEPDSATTLSQSEPSYSISILDPLPQPVP